MTLTVDDLHVHIAGTPIVHGINLHVPSGTVTAVVGPNGSGKSTLVRAVYRAVRPARGIVRVDGVDVWRLRARHAARLVAGVPQRTPSDLELTAFEVAMLGRIPHPRNDHVDRAAAGTALERVGMSQAARRSFATLSGGEQQRVLLARALAQSPALLVVDEPTNHLDVRYQHEVLTLIRSLGLTTLAVLHDLSLAAAYADAVVVLDAGRVRASGSAAKALDPHLIGEVFQVGVHVLEHPHTGSSVFAFFPLTATGPDDSLHPTPGATA